MHDEDRVRAAYDEVADDYADHFRATEAEQAAELGMLRHFVSLLREPRRVLDAGCGAGRMMPVLADAGCEVSGVDLSPEMIRRARLDHPEFDSRVRSLTDLPYADASFDGVLAWYSTIHSPDEDLPRIMAEAARVLTRGGLLLLGFQTGAGARDVAGGYRDRGHDIELIRHHRSPATVEQLLDRSGYIVLASMRRAACGRERDGQSVVIAAAPQD